MEIEKIYYKHYRYPGKRNPSLFEIGLHRYSRGKTTWQPACKGGQTECHVVLRDGREIVGFSECSKKDNFVYEVGRNIARGRAMKLYHRIMQDERDYRKALCENDK